MIINTMIIDLKGAMRSDAFTSPRDQSVQVSSVNPNPWLPNIS